MFLILTGLILTFFCYIVLLLLQLFIKNSLPTTHQDYNYPSSPTAHTLKRWQPDFARHYPRARYRIAKPVSNPLGQDCWLAFC